MRKRVDYWDSVAYFKNDKGKDERRTCATLDSIRWVQQLKIDGKEL